VHCTEMRLLMTVQGQNQPTRLIVETVASPELTDITGESRLAERDKQPSGSVPCNSFSLREFEYAVAAPAASP
jgi:hypothetical protein